MVLEQIFAGHKPFSDTPDAGVILKLSQGKHPKKPEGAIQLGLTDPIWETVEACWKTQPSTRLTVTQVLEVWEKEISGGNIPVEAEQGKQRLGFKQRGELFVPLLRAAK